MASNMFFCLELLTDSYTKIHFDALSYPKNQYLTLGNFVMSG
jgi:hypothetical protein